MAPRVNHRPATLLSAALIARDEERFIGPCLRSLDGLVDEIVVVDTGSADRTPDIARAAGAHLAMRAGATLQALAADYTVHLLVIPVGGGTAAGGPTRGERGQPGR